METDTTLAKVDETDADLAEVADGDVGTAIRLHGERETNLEAATHSIEAAAQALTGMRLWRTNAQGQRECALVYVIPNRGSGITVRCMNALVDARGNFETIDQEPEQCVTWEGKLENGEQDVQTTSAIRVKTRVLDRLTNNVHMGMSKAPLFQRRRDGTLYETPGDPEDLAAAKSLRKAQEKHFAGVIDALKQLILDEFNAGRDHFSGIVPEGDVGGEDARDAMAAKREAKGKLTVGHSRANAFINKVKALDNELEGDAKKRFRSDWQAYRTARCPGGELAEAPESVLTEAEGELTKWREAFGGEATEVPQEPAPDAETPPTPETIRDLISTQQWSADEVTALHTETGLDEGADLDPDQCADLYADVMRKLEADSAEAQATLAGTEDDDD